MLANKAIVFDVGRVLIDFSFLSFESFLSSKGAKLNTPEEFFKFTRLYDFETGQITAQEFVESVQKLLKDYCSTDEIIYQWTNIFKPIPEMLSFCQEISSKVRTFIMSNTNSLHWDYLNNEYNINSLTTHAITSFEVKSMKPDPLIYQKLEERVELSPENILFIDDLLANTTMGNTRGWKTIHHQNVENTIIEINKFLNDN